MESVESRFLRYVAIDTQSDPHSETYPSTSKQLGLLGLLVEEMMLMGISDVSFDPNGYVTGTIPSTTTKDIPAIAFIAHVDTSPDLSGAGVKPRTVKYEGGDIVLNAELAIVLKASDSPELSSLKGQTIITTDGTTLLGADDKAGVAEIMAAAEYLMHNPQIPHGDICIAFTPDEEIGRGVDFFDVKALDARWGYTIDGGMEGELEYENFNAASAKITIRGSNVHPGYAKGRMINACRVAAEIDSLVPEGERPENTSGYEGFFHLTAIESSVEHGSMEYIIRDHDRTAFENRKKLLMSAVENINSRYGQHTAICEIKDQYYNMREIIEPRMHIVEIAAQAMREAGVEPQIKPIRGGTDGSRLSFMGLPCPNIFAGGVNFHSKYEFISVEVMRKAVDTIVKIAEITARG